MFKTTHTVTTEDINNIIEVLEQIKDSPHMTGFINSATANEVSGVISVNDYSKTAISFSIHSHKLGGI